MKKILLLGSIILILFFSFVISDWELYQTLTHPYDDVFQDANTLDFNHDGSLLAVGFTPDTTSVDDYAIVYNTTTWEIEEIITNSGDWIESINFNHDGSLLAFIKRYPDELLIYNTTTWDLEENFTEISYLFSPDKDLIFIEENGSISIPTQDSYTEDLFFSSNGSKLYEISSSKNKIYQYSLSTPWDLSTANYDNINISTQDIEPMSLFFSSNGSKLYEIGEGSFFNENDNYIYQYSLSTPWDLSTATYDNINISTQGSSPRGLFFNSEGTKLYESNYNYIHQYSLSTPWDLSTATYDNINISTQDSSPSGLFFSSDGYNLYETRSYINDKIYQYSLSTPWDLSTANYKHISVYNTTSWDLEKTFFSLKSILALNNDSSLIVLDGEDNNSYIYNTTTWALEQTLINSTKSSNYLPTIFSYDNSLLAIGNDLDNSVKIYNTTTGLLEENILLQPSGQVALSLGFSPTEDLLAIGCIDDPDDGIDSMIFLYNTTSWDLEKTLPRYFGYFVWDLDFNHEGDLLAFTGGWSSYVYIFDFKALRISLTSPINNYNTTNQVVNFITSLSIDDGYSITNSSLVVNNSIEQTNTSGLAGIYNFSETLSDGFYEWYVEAYDNNNLKYESDTRYIRVDSTNPTTVLGTKPINNSFTTNETVIFDFKAYDNMNVDEIKLYGNFTGSWLVNYTNTSYINNTWINLTKTLSEGVYLWGVESIDNIMDVSTFSENRTLTVDHTAPNVNIISPKSQQYNYNESLKLNYTSIDSLSPINSCWYKIVNSTDNILVNNQTITDCENITFDLPRDDIYNLTLYSNDSAGNIGEESIQFEITTTSPAISIDFPEQGHFFNHGEDISINFTATDENGVDTCKLYSNFTGSWGLNETFSSITSGVQESTSKNLTEGYYKFNIWCNDSLGNEGFALNNRTFGIDLTYPNLTIDSITTTAGSQTISFNTTLNESNINYCSYSIYNLAGSVDGSNENKTFNCVNASATVSGFATYELRVYAYDLANNGVMSNNTFTTSATTGGTIGGGGGSTIIIPAESTWIMETAPGQSLYQKKLPKNSQTDLSLSFENLGDSSRKIKLSCENLEGDGCKFVSFQEDEFDLPLLKDTKTIKIFTITTDNVQEEYKFNIVAIDEFNKKNIITVDLEVGGLGLLSVFYKLGLKSPTGIPYIVVFFPVLILFMITFNKLLDKVPLKVFWSFLISFLIASLSISFW